MSTPDDHFAALIEFNRKLMEHAAKSLRQTDGLDVAEVFKSLTAGAASDTKRWLEIQSEFYRRQLELWSGTATASGSAAGKTDADAAQRDRRFKAPEWQEPYFKTLAQSYLLTSNMINQLVDNTKLETHAKKKLAFYARQMIDAMSPANYPWSNPEALKLASQTDGESVARGMKNLTQDIDKGMVSMTDDSAFEVGRNLAITPGAVVFENDFFQLIQYRPTTATVYQRPLLMVPPCINKFYILDLQPHNSYVRFALDEGHTVFMVSWRNMPEDMGRTTWDDYVEQGVIRAIDTVTEICGAGQINVLGFCVGGTLLACALAVLRARERDPAVSLTLLATMLDFSDTGELSVFIDEPYVQLREQEFALNSVVHGRELALTFASLRANELIWHYVVNNYLKGNTPEPFDLLYWNGDGTNLPGTMYAYYVRNMYLENNLRIPDRLQMCGVPVDLGRIGLPTYVLAARDDHIVPWKTAYSSSALLGDKTEFVLTASGHIAGVINPVSKNRRNYWLNSGVKSDPEQWLADAQSQPGSWWAHWSAWLAQHGGTRQAARAELGSGNYAEIEPAPGRYVRVRGKSAEPSERQP